MGSAQQNIRQDSSWTGLTKSGWFPTIAPLTSITLAALVAAALAIITILLALRGPYLGVEFDRSYDGGGVRVARVHLGGPAAGQLQAGDIIKSVAAPIRGTVELSYGVVQEDPDALASYAEYNAFFALQQTLWEVISSPSFTVILSDGLNIQLAASEWPGPVFLPMPFWWLLLFGGVSFVLGASVWSLHRSEAVTRVLAVSGLGYMLGAYSCALYLARELALPADFFFVAASVNHLGIMLFAYAAILFFWYYPRQLGNAPAAWILAASVALLWLNETLQWWSWPAHAFYAHFVVAYCLLLIFNILQWRKSRGEPLERAMLKWLLVTILLSLGFTVFLFYIPIILTGKAVASTVLTFAAVFAFYVGLIMGVVRYRQFDMEYWWHTAWQWLIFILLVLLADALFVYYMNLNNAASIGLSLGAGSVYLLARQWFWSRFSGSGSRAMDQALPHLVDALIQQQQQKSSPAQQWQQLVARVFNPLTLKLVPGLCNNVSIARSGLLMQIPGLDGKDAIEILCCDHGKRLFVSSDVHLARRLLELMRHSRDIITAHEQGVQEERQRIQRDLHDDVAARLLSLLHQTREPVISKVARSALRGLRDVIHLLGAEESVLEDVMTDIEAATREQISGMGVRLHWHSPGSWPAVMLSSQQHINLLRIVREAVANALKHAHPENITLEIACENYMLAMRVSNDGAISEASTWKLGRGVNNIKHRVAEMSGSHEWVIEQSGGNGQYCALALTIPLVTNDKLETDTADRGL